MKKKYTLTLDEEFVKFCELNNIQDIDKKAKETFNRGFAILKYGESPVKRHEIIEVKEDVISNNLIEELQEKNKKLTEKLNQLTETKTKVSKTKKNNDNTSLYDE